MGLFFDATGKLSYENDCKVCSRFPLEGSHEPCLSCGYSQDDIKSICTKVEAMNLAYDKHGDEIEDNNRNARRAFLQIHNISLGGDNFDFITLADIDMSDDIRQLADLTDHMVELIIVPTDIKHRDWDGDDW